MRATGLLTVALLTACAGSEPASGAQAVPPDADAGADAGVAEAPPAPTAFSGVLSLWGSGPDDVWAVGEGGLVFHRGPGGWQAVPSGTTNALNAVHGAGPSDVWAAGEQVILHFDGTAWSTVLEQPSELYLGAWSNGPRDVWIVGTALDVVAGVVLHWDGQTWSSGATSRATSLWEVWSSGGDDVWTVGTAAGGTGYMIHGKAMNFSRLPFEGAPLRGIWGQAPDDLWVVPYHAPLQRWDGVAFSQPSGTADLSLMSVHGTGPADVWSVGLHGAILHWDGAAWSRSDSGTTDHLITVWAASPQEAWAAGGSTVLHWSGGRWQRE